jgi:signal transduction histidine kinase
MERGMLTGVGLLRGVTFVWMLVVLILQRHDLSIGWLAWAVVGTAGVVTVWLSALRRSRPDALLEPAPVVLELVVGLALMACDGIVYPHGHVGSSQSSLAETWPLAGVLSVGVAFGERYGLGAGLAMGVAHFVSAPLNGVLGSLRSSQVLSFVSTIVLYSLVGAVAGYAVRLVREADDQVARARTREEVSRALHDGVLQTLALVERRETDPQLASLAREQERELRGFLAGYAATDQPGRAGSGATGQRSLAGHRPRPSAGRRSRQPAVARGQLEANLRRVVGRFEDTYSARADVVVSPDTPTVDARHAEALAGAVAEALVNAGKHGHATRATIFVEPADGDRVFCSVKDNGEGFDPGATSEGMGIRGSIRGRVEGAGGRVEIESAPGRGAEVMLWL